MILLPNTDAIVRSSLWLLSRTVGITSCWPFRWRNSPNRAVNGINTRCPAREPSTGSASVISVSPSRNSAPNFTHDRFTALAVQLHSTAARHQRRARLLVHPFAVAQPNQRRVLRLDGLIGRADFQRGLGAVRLRLRQASRGNRSRLRSPRRLARRAAGQPPTACPDPWQIAKRRPP